MGKPVWSKLEHLEQRRLFAAGEIDSTFGVGGLLKIDVGGDHETVTQMLHAPGGKILAFARLDTDGALAIARFNADGSIDASFGSGGKVVTSLMAPFGDEPGAVAVSSAGRIAVVYGNNGSAAPNGVAVFTAAGVIDTSFSNDGLLGIDGPFISFDGVGFQSDGRLIIAGMGFDLTNAPPAAPWNPDDYVDPVLIRRYSATGVLDTGFGNGTGLMDGTTVLTRGDGMEDFIVMPDNRIVVATRFDDDATTTTEAVLGQEIFRLNANGLVDNTFDGDGALIVGEIVDPSSSDTSQTLDMEVLDDGSMLVLSQEGQLNTVLRKFTAAGQPAAGFSTELDRLGRFPKRVGIAGNGNIYLSDNGSVARYSPTGSADYSYGTDGVTTIAHGSAALVNDDGSVIVGGSTVPTAVDPADLQFVRLQNGTGSPRRPTLNSKGTLVFRTTNSNETISIGMRTRDNKLVVRLGTFAQAFTPSRVKRIAIYAMGGDDSVTIGAGIRGCYVEGGDGDDSLNGGQGGDVLLGGAGRDRVIGNDGDDILLGGAGNDYLLGAAGKDDLFGDAGLDTLSGAGGNDRLFGGTGDADVVNGGNGADSAGKSDDDKFSSIEAMLNIA